MSNTLTNTQLNQKVKELQLRVKELEEIQLKNKQPESLLSALYVNAIKTSPFGISIYNSSGDCIIANEVIGHIIGATKEQVLQQNYHQIESWKKSGLYAKALKAIKTNKNQYYEGLISTTFGVTNYYAFHLVSFSDEKEQYLMFVADKINARMQLESALKESEELARLALKGADLGFWDYNIPSGKTYFDKSSLSMLGYNEGDIEQNINEWKELMHPDDVSKSMEKLQDHFNDPEVKYETEFRLKTKQGDYKWILSRGEVLERDENGKPVRMNGTHLDITERKLTEASLAQNCTLTTSGVESMPIAWILLDPELRVVEWNKSAETIFGWTKAEMVGEKVSEYIVPPEVSPIVDEVLLKLQKGETASYSEKDNNIRKDGSAITCKWYNSSICDENGLITAILILAEDITEYKLVEEELLKARKLESVGLLAGGIAHDFNNILTGLFGNIELAKRKLSPDHKAQNYIENAGQALERATGLTQQLLTFAKGGDPILDVINIGQVIEESIKFSLSGSNVKTSINMPDDLWHVKADKGQLSQVITNLVINAKQAMPDGGVLTIETENIVDCHLCRTTHLPKECVRLTVRDEGMGISKAHLEKIFDPYFTTKQTGSGLGLATVHSIIYKHGGQISVDSELGVGTTFTILLHADNSVSQAIDTTSLDVTEKSDSISGHVLVMDDDEMILNLSTEIIKTFGYTVDTAVDGKEAIEKYISAKKSGKAFDVVIMDLTIPGSMGGKETLQELLTLDPEVKAIVSSGYSTDHVMANYREYGFTGRLVKPFQMDELQKELSSQIGSE